MTLFDFLAQAGFLQWMGVLALATLLMATIVGSAYGLGKFRIFSIKNIYQSKASKDG